MTLWNLSSPRRVIGMDSPELRDAMAVLPAVNNAPARSEEPDANGHFEVATPLHVPAFVHRAPTGPLIAIFLLVLLVLGGAGYGLADILNQAEAPATVSTTEAHRLYANAPLAPAEPAKVPVEPVRLINLSQDDARALNNSIPFSTAPNPAARRFAPTLQADSFNRAVDCLAAAVWFETGDDAVGEMAVAQVIINRLRHPAFPHSVCGVVFQGSERRTGCQFTFTCDGAMQRTPSAAAWQRARSIALSALSGSVFAPVGYATHYHTDWVFPYWSSHVDKIAAVGTHLFFRWTGPAGRPGAFTSTHVGTEPFIAKMVRLSPAHASRTVPNLPTDLNLAEAGAMDFPTVESPVATPTPQRQIDVPTSALRGQRLESADQASNRFQIRLVDTELSGNIAVTALNLCLLQPQKACEVRGSISGNSTDFLFVRDMSRGVERAQWNCAVMPRPNPSQCL